MDIRRCTRCGKLFQYALGDITCSSCKKLTEEEFQKCKSYIWDNPGVTIAQVSKACEVDKKYIKQWLKEDRLQLSDDAVDLELTCEHCGKPITGGRFCLDCKKANLAAMQQLAPKRVAVTMAPKKSSDSKMRFFT